MTKYLANWCRMDATVAPWVLMGQKHHIFQCRHINCLKWKGCLPSLPPQLSYCRTNLEISLAVIWNELNLFLLVWEKCRSYFVGSRFKCESCGVSDIFHAKPTQLGQLDSTGGISNTIRFSGVHLDAISISSSLICSNMEIPSITHITHRIHVCYIW